MGSCIKTLACRPPSEDLVICGAKAVDALLHSVIVHVHVEGIPQLIPRYRLVQAHRGVLCRIRFILLRSLCFLCCVWPRVHDADARAECNEICPHCNQFRQVCKYDTMRACNLPEFRLTDPSERHLPHLMRTAPALSLRDHSAGSHVRHTRTHAPYARTLYVGWADQISTRLAPVRVPRWVMEPEPGTL